MPKCAMPTCDNDVEIGSNGQWKKHCSLKCRGKHNSIVGTEKRKLTCLEKFGATTNLKTDETKDKIKTTLKERYGVDHQMHIQSVKDKIKTTCTEKYGVDNPSKSDDIKRKKVATSLINYGVEFPLRSAEVQAFRRVRSMEKYGVDHYSKTDTFRLLGTKNQAHILPENYKKLKDKEWLELNSDKSCTELAAMLGVTKDTVAKAFRRNGIKNTASHTYAEMEIANYIKQFYTDEIITNTRKIIKPYELDIFIPGINLAIEYDGIFWHSETNKPDPMYHAKKTAMCNAKGVRLIHVLDSEWLNRRNIVESRIKSVLGINDVIYARKCDIKKLSIKEYAQFFDETHIQGSANATVCYGLMDNGCIVAAMSFVKSRFNRNMQWELLRFANKLGISVVGGADKLLSHFKKTHLPRSIVSYCDLRWNTGNMYEKIGFSLAGKSAPNYWYTANYSGLESRLKYQKHKLEKVLSNYDSELTEWENMQAHGFDRVWDCGNLVYKWWFPPTNGDIPPLDTK